MQASNPYIFFGIDLSGLASRWRLASEQVMWGSEYGCYHSYCAPARLRQLDGELVVQLEDGSSSGRESSDTAAWVDAVELTDDLCLFRHLVLPAAAEAELKNAVALDVMANSPFPAGDTRYGYRVTGRGDDSLELTLVIASAPVIDQWMRQRWPEIDLAGSSVELWAPLIEGGHIILGGYGEQRRRDEYRAHLRSLALQTLVAPLLILLALAVPGLATEMRLSSLNEQLSDLRAETAGVRSLRSDIDVQRELVDELSAMAADRVYFDYWLNTIAELTPDSAYFLRMDFEGRKIDVSGLADNAASYLTILAESGQLGTVDAPGAFTRDRRSGLERFQIAIELPEEAP